MNAFLDVFKTQAGLIADDLRLRLGGLAKDERGVSAVEFAMLLPMMLTSARSRFRRASAPTAR
ncbi:MAG TPA: hypothetical protein VEW06_10665 [Xanthobacteraceae bacterium]|jgi:Flp pilus assembly protein TadG|nr:hypothetical protein [Xanthobacteraceae bacterium]